MAAEADRCAIVALGMITPLGHGAEASCAALRAGLTRFAELPGLEIEGAPVIGASVRGVTDGLSGVDRFARLVSAAAADLTENAVLGDRALATAGFYLATPSSDRADRSDIDPHLAATLGARLGTQLEIASMDARRRVFATGHAGVVAALAEAMKDLRARRIPRAVVGGVDSLVAPETVAHYHAKGRLKHGDRPVGIMPGEAAAFFVVELLATAEARGAPIFAVVDAPSTAIEPITIDAGPEGGVCDGSGLTDAARRTLTALADGGASTGLLVGDLNGEPYRSEELAYMITRAFAGVKLRAPAPLRLWHAADGIGDTGAASAAVAIAQAARALHRGYARTDGVLIFASSEAGLRGTVFLRKYTKG